MKEKFGYRPYGPYWTVNLNVKLNDEQKTWMFNRWHPDISMEQHGEFTRFKGAVRGSNGLYEFMSDLKIARLNTAIAKKQQELQEAEYDRVWYEEARIEQVPDVIIV